MGEVPLYATQGSSVGKFRFAFGTHWSVDADFDRKGPSERKKLWITFSTAVESKGAFSQNGSLGARMQ